MLGDVKFHEQRGIEAEVAERWQSMDGSRTSGGRAQLSGVTWSIAESLGYQREESRNNGRSMIGKRVRLPLVNIQPVGSKRPLFCIHPAGGYVICYAELARQLGEEQPLYGLQSPSLNGKREPFTRVEEMATCYLKALRDVQPEGPYLLAGYSSGGFVAFEMAQQLQKQGEEAALVAIFDIEAAPQKEELNEMDDALLLAGVLRYSLSLSVEHMRQLNPEEQLSYVLDLGKKENILPPNFDLSEAGYFLNTLRSNVKASAEYLAQPYDGRIILFRASDHNIMSDPTLGWGNVAKRGVDLYVVPGNHVTMIAKPNIKILAERLKHCLDQAQANDSV
jgi:thioesterase domain-containing protein